MCTADIVNLVITNIRPATFTIGPYTHITNTPHLPVTGDPSLLSSLTQHSVKLQAGRHQVWKLLCPVHRPHVRAALTMLQSKYNNYSGYTQSHTHRIINQMFLIIPSLTLKGSGQRSITPESNKLYIYMYIYITQIGGQTIRFMICRKQYQSSINILYIYNIYICIYIIYILYI